MRNASAKFAEKLKTHILKVINFSEIRAVSKMMGGNMIENERPREAV
jgi:hypothetical protein